MNSFDSEIENKIYVQFWLNCFINLLQFFKENFIQNYFIQKKSCYETFYFIFNAFESLYFGHFYYTFFLGSCLLELYPEKLNKNVQKCYDI